MQHLYGRSCAVDVDIWCSTYCCNKMRGKSKGDARRHKHAHFHNTHITWYAGYGDLKRYIEEKHYFIFFSILLNKPTHTLIAQYASASFSPIFVAVEKFAGINLIRRNNDRQQYISIFLPIFNRQFIMQKVCQSSGLLPC